MARILLVLRRMHTGIVGNREDHSSVNTYVRHRKQRICRHIQPHMLHGTKRACSSKRSSRSCFRCNLLVWCPFAINLDVYKRQRRKRFQGDCKKCIRMILKAFYKKHFCFLFLFLDFFLFGQYNYKVGLKTLKYF